MMPNQGGPSRFIIQGIAAGISAFVLFFILSNIPQHMPGLKTSLPPRDITLGVWEKKDFFGLTETQATYMEGQANGDAVQYYPTGAILREMYYVNGKLESKMREFYNRPGYRAAPPSNVLPPEPLRQRMRGMLRGVWSFQNGVLEGPYEKFHENGNVQESGTYSQGKLTGNRRKYSPDGKLKSEKNYPQKWEPSKNSGLS